MNFAKYTFNAPMKDTNHKTELKDLGKVKKVEPFIGKFH